MPDVRRLTGWSAIGLALIYMAGFAYFGALFEYPAEASSSEKMAFLAARKVDVTIAYLTIYVVFGVLLAFLVVGLHEIQKIAGARVPAYATAFGLVWVTLVVASGMIWTSGLDQALTLLETHPVDAAALWRVVSVIANSIGGANEVIGGLWVLLVSILSLRADLFPRALNGLGLLVGTAGVATLYPSELIAAVFGLTQIAWFLSLGVTILRRGD